MKRIPFVLLLAFLFSSCGEIPPPFVVSATSPTEGGTYRTSSEFSFDFTPTDPKKGMVFYNCLDAVSDVTSVSGCATKPTIRAFSSYGFGGCEFDFSSDGSCRTGDQVAITLDLSKVAMMSLGQSTAENGKGTYKLTFTVQNEKPSVTYTIGGTLSGASGPVTLQNNGGDTLTVAANGAFTFPTGIGSGSTYSVAVTATHGLDTCSVDHGSGTVGSANITNVAVQCSP